MNSKASNHSNRPAMNGANGPAAGLEDESSLSLLDLFRIFVRRRELFLLVAVPVFLAILAYRLTRPYTPQYMASFDVGVSNERPVEGFFSPNPEAPTVQIGSVTQRVISNLLSVYIARKIVDTLALAVHVRNMNSDFRVEVVYAAELSEPSGPYRLKFTDGGYAVYSRSGEWLAEARAGDPVDLGFVQLKVIPLKPVPANKLYTVTFYPPGNTALALRNSLSIKVLEADKIDKGTGATGIPYSGEGASKNLVSAQDIFPGMNLLGILRINVYWGTPENALRIAQVLSDRIIREDISEKSRQYIQSRDFISSQLDLYQDKLNELEDKIKVFKEQKKIANLDASTRALITQISTIESRKSQIQIEETILRNLNAYLAAADASLDSALNFAPALLSDQVLQNLYSQLLQVEAELRGQLKEYSAGHPKVMETRARLGGLKDQMKEEVIKRLAAIKTELGSVDKQIASLQVKLENVPADEIQLARLERDRETAEKLYTFFAEKLEETRVQEAGVTSDLKIINPPILARNPVNSRGRLTSLVLALVIAVLAGGAVIFVAEYADNTVKEPDQVKARVGLPIFASIPDLDPAGESGILKKYLDRIQRRRPRREPPLRIISEDISSAEFEAFRKLSINLEFAHPQKRYSVLYVTSAGPEEGKTFLALNLGVVLMYTGKKVAVIDTDFRKKRGHLSDVTRARKETGIFDVLQGRAALPDTIIRLDPEQLENGRAGARKDQANKSGPPIHPLAIIPIGAVPPNPFVFLESARMKEVIGELRAAYDHVIIDGLPVLLFADATYLAAYCDGVLLCARYGRTNIKELEDTRDILASSQSDIVGVVMNAVPRTPGSYYYQHYYRYYSKYYKKDQGDS